MSYYGQKRLKECLVIKNMVKKLLIYVRNSIKVISIMALSAILICCIVIFLYKPTYSVTLGDKQIGYSENKSKLQARINEYIDHGDGQNENVAFVEVENLPQYRLCLLKKDIVTNDDEIFKTIQETGTTYYKYYSIVEDGVEKVYVGTFEQAEEIIEALKEKESTNVDHISILEKYETNLTDFIEKEEAVSQLYTEPVKTVTVAKKTNTKTQPKQASYSTQVASTSTDDAKMSSIGISFINPTSGSISSRYGRRWNRQHAGIDVAASTGTPIYAAAGGTVTYSAYNSGGYGYLVKISHGNGVETYYGHCSQLLVSAGEHVSQGQAIARVGSTGRSTGPHLHFEVRVGGTPQNPLNYVY